MQRSRQTKNRVAVFGCDGHLIVIRAVLPGLGTRSVVSMSRGVEQRSMLACASHNPSASSLLTTSLTHSRLLRTWGCTCSRYAHNCALALLSSGLQNSGATQPHLAGRFRNTGDVRQILKHSAPAHGSSSARFGVIAEHDGGETTTVLSCCLTYIQRCTRTPHTLPDTPTLPSKHPAVRPHAMHACARSSPCTSYGTRYIRRRMSADR